MIHSKILYKINENYGILQSKTKLLLKQTNSASIGVWRWKDISFQ